MQIIRIYASSRQAVAASEAMQNASLISAHEAERKQARGANTPNKISRLRLATLRVYRAVVTQHWAQRRNESSSGLTAQSLCSLDSKSALLHFTVCYAHTHMLLCVALAFTLELTHASRRCSFSACFVLYFSAATFVD